jgi:hypothetical protein
MRGAVLYDGAEVHLLNGLQSVKLAQYLRLFMIGGNFSLLEERLKAVKRLRISHSSG